MADSDRRQFTRISFQGQASLVLASGEYEVDIIDLSLKGALVRPCNPLEAAIGSDGTLNILLDQDGQVIRMKATVGHHRGDCYGLVCREIDLDSITHLRRLVALNLGDESLLEREVGLLIEA